ncbi:MAG: DUF262 domain-containing protein [Magnetococcales bacterium]|nr:DUF262 domain-containing protein [Magnetococcales bacterium]
MSQTPEVKPEIMFIFDLIRRVEQGIIRIPAFQRLFVWKRDHMRDLLDSIRNQYPIGSLLLWSTDSKIVCRESFGPVYVQHTEQKRISLVLDGQQRLSTLVGTLKMPHKQHPATPHDKDPGRWRIHFNAQNEQFEYLLERESVKSWHFPLWKMLDTFAFLEEMERIKKEAGEQNGQIYIKKIQELSRTFQNYKLPVITIENTDLAQAVTIFSRLNAKGLDITMDEMVSAMTYGEKAQGTTDFNLASKIDEILEEIGPYGFGDIDRPIIVRAFLANMGQDIYRTDWTFLKDPEKSTIQEKLINVSDKTKKALVAAIHFLKEMGAHTERLLPYAMQLVILSSFFGACLHPTSTQKHFLRRWFWVSSFTGWFASGNPSRVADMAKEFREEIANNPNPTSLQSMDLNIPAQPFSASFDMRSARTRIQMLILLALGPKDRQGHSIHAPWEQLASQGSYAFAYFFPSMENKSLQSSPANRILRIKGNVGTPSKWLKGLNQIEREKRLAILLSHAIPEEAYEELLADNQEAFIRLRMEYIRSLENETMQREKVTLPTGEAD